MYSTEENEMHTLFFGGIAQFYREGGERVPLLLSENIY
jgi:hypothetical protein